MTRKKESPVVAVLCGGSSAEAEVSRSSGHCVAEALRSSYANVSLLELDASIAELLGEVGAEVVFPILHGPPGEDGTLQGFLEVLRLPYVGSGVRASALAIDKVVSKQVFRAHGLPVARDLVVDRSEGSSSAVRRARDHLGDGLVVKPASQGSAVGVKSVPVCLRLSFPPSFIGLHPSTSVESADPPCAVLPTTPWHG